MRRRDTTPLLVRESGLLLLLILASSAAAQVPQVREEAATTGTIDSLHTKALRIADSYAQVEQLILRMAEMEALSNPSRAALLKQAAQQSADRRIRKDLEAATTLLAPPQQLKRAIEEGEQALADLKALLELLLSEDRADRLKAEEQRIREYIKEVERLIRLQRSAEGQTRGSGDPQRIADEQERIANRTGDLAEKIRENEEGGRQSGNKAATPAESPSSRDNDGPREPNESENQPGKASDSQGQDETPGENDSQKPDEAQPERAASPPNEPSPGQPQPGEAAPGEPSQPGQEPQPGQPSQPSQPSRGQPSPGQPGEPSEQSGQPGQSGQEPLQDQSHPARQRLQAAEERMREAQRRLEEARREQAVEEQEKARHELEKAKAELEEILRQLREEEIGRTLALLEGRFRRMLEKQLEIYENTKRLDKIAADQPSRQVDIQASKLGFEETKLAVEADKALLLLFEEGSSIAFPETVEQMRDDMQQVADRLSKTNLGAITQGIEEEIIQALEEMIAALQKAQQELEEQQRQQQQQPQSGDPAERPLVDAIAELKMIRALQMRVNTRTQRFARLLADENDPVGQTEDEELRGSLIKLGERQQRIHEVTRDIVLGKNR